MNTLRTSCLVALLIAGWLTSAQAHASQADALLLDLSSDNAVAQVHARQLLPRLGMEPVPGLLNLLEHPKEAVWRAARNTLADIANETGAPGHETDRAHLSNAFLKNIAAGDHATARRELLRLLPILAREGDDIAALGPLLQDLGWREDARMTLSSINTPQAHALLIGGLESPDQEFRVALMNTLAQLRYKGDMTAILQQMGKGPDETQYAAVRVLFGSGGISQINLIENVLGAQDNGYNTGELILDYADRLYDAGGQWQAAMKVYALLLKRSNNPAIKGAAMARLGQRGDETVIPLIIEAMKQDENLVAPAVAGLIALRGPARHEALETGFAAVPELAKPMFYAPMAEEGSEAFLKRVAEEAQSGKPNAELALAALIHAASPVAVGQLVARIQGDAAEATAWLDKLQQLALRLEQKGNGAAAGDAWLNVYQYGKEPALRATALEGIKRNPAPGAFKLVFDNSSEEELKAVPAALLVSVVMQSEENAPERAKALSLLQGRLNESAAVQALCSAANAAGQAAWGAQMVGAIRSWQIAGPFPWVHEGNFGSAAIDPAKVDTAQPVQSEGKTFEWKPFESGDAAGLVDLMGPLGGEHVCAYAVARIRVEAATAAQLKVGSDDAVKAWLNGAVVHENLIDRGYALDSDTAPLQLNAGENVLVLKLGQNAGGWNFGARLTGADGFPLPFK
ncbi:MAG: hypothetical protein HYV27_20270 [Candidatus Hydrogenedentes bacterium]|nr:hypothetical protein [Candidatus Hydrogenedentota bacterium]